MKPKEKALSIFDKMNGRIPIEASISDTKDDAIRKMKQDHAASKACAIVVVDEILDLDTGDTIDKSFWREVESEIEKL